MVTIGRNDSKPIKALLNTTTRNPTREIIITTDGTVEDIVNQAVNNGASHNNIS